MHLTRLASTLAMMLGVAWYTLTRNKFTGSAIRDWRSTMGRVRKGAALFVHPWTHFRVATTLSRRAIRPVLDIAPLLPFKYLTDYLKTGMSRSERASILVHHYTVLGSRANEPFFRAIVGPGVEVWRTSVGDSTYRIVLTFPREIDAEGDLALVFRDSAKGLYALSFTLGPGSMARFGAKDVMYIARVQGKGGALDLIRKATKECLEISPAALLLSAAEGIAIELGVNRIIGISAHAQLSVDRARTGDLVTAYDEFWLAVGGQTVGGDMYQLMVPLAEKPLSLIARSHRPRVRRKRAFKAKVSEEVRLKFSQALSHGPATLSEAEAG